ncbi:MAG: hypothetical protein Q8910_00580 [Bacteroidota bacterium]|nr:hypothetical protein [Bacteroidota bacterium]
MARLIPAGKKIVKGRTSYSATIILSKIPQFLLDNPISYDAEWFLQKFYIDSISYDSEEGCSLEVILPNEPNGGMESWVKSFDNIIDYTIHVETNHREFWHDAYIEHDFLLQDSNDGDYEYIYVHTYDLLNPTENGELYESEAWAVLDDPESVFGASSTTLKKRNYKTQEEATIGHYELVKQWIGSHNSD